MSVLLTTLGTRVFVLHAVFIKDSSTLIVFLKMSLLSTALLKVIVLMTVLEILTVSDSFL